MGQRVNYSLLMPAGFGKCSNYLSFLLQLDFAMNTCKGLPSNSKMFYFLLASPDLQELTIPLVSLELSLPICLLFWRWMEALSFCFQSLGLEKTPLRLNSWERIATLRNINSLFFQLFQGSPLKKILYIYDCQAKDKIKRNWCANTCAPLANITNPFGIKSIR